LVTRSAGQSSQFTQLLQQQGAIVLEVPAIEITPPSSWIPLDQAIAHLSQFDWLILTSTNGVDYFLERCAAQSKTLTDLTDLKIAVVGQKTAASLERQGRSPDFIPPQFVADALVEHFPEPVAGLKILFPRVESGGRDVLVKALTAAGALITEVPAYESGCVSSLPPTIQTALQRGIIDILTFASSKTVHCFAQLVQPLAIELPLIASIGPQTSVSCQQQFGRVDIEATEYTLEGLTAAIVNWAQHHPSRSLPPQQFLSRIIGITGGVGMGKTMVSNYLHTVHHLPILDADLYARQAVQPGSQVLAEVVRRYGATILLPTGELDRARLGDLIFNSDPERQWLEQQIHPYVRDCMERDLKQLALTGHPTAVLVIPLLFEARMTDLVTEIWVVRSPETQQVERLQQRDRLNLAQIRARISSQMPIEKKIAQATVVLDNSSTPEILFAQVDRALGQERRDE
jgi:dephospho-CoA kinase